LSGKPYSHLEKIQNVWKHSWKDNQKKDWENRFIEKDYRC
jgi:hypothetical protein